MESERVVLIIFPTLCRLLVLITPNYHVKLDKAIHLYEQSGRRAAPLFMVPRLTTVSVGQYTDSISKCI
jgi:hypothetical protein